MDKQRYGVRQRVTEGNLNQLQDYTEAGIEAVASDIVVGGGVVSGMTVTAASAFQVSLAAGRARDANGARVSILAAVNLDLAASKPAAGQERWATIMAYRSRQQADPRVDSNGATYYFQLTETTQLQVVTGASAAAGAAARPARPNDGGVLVADVLLKGSAAAIVAGDISTTRREVYSPVANLPAGQITFTPAPAGGYAAGVDQVQEALDDVGARLATHQAADDPHPQYATDAELANYVPTSTKGQANGVASLGGDGKVPAAQLPASATGSYIPTSEKGANSGVATLTAAGKLVQDAQTVGGKAPGAAAGNLPILDANLKLPHSITGDAASVAGKVPGSAAGNLAVLDANARVPNATQLQGSNPTSAGGTEASAIAKTNANGRVGDAEKLQGKVTGTAAGNIPVLDGAAKLPHSITGDAATVAGKAPGAAAGNLAVLDANARVADAVKLAGASPTTGGGVEANSIAKTNASGRVGDAEKVAGKTPGSAAGNIPVLDQAAKVPAANLPPFLDPGAANGNLANLFSLLLPVDTRSWEVTAWDEASEQPTAIQIKDGATVLASITVAYNTDAKPISVTATADGRTFTWTITWTGNKLNGYTKAVS